MAFETDDEVRAFLRDHAHAIAEADPNWNEARADKNAAIEALRLDLTRKLEPVLRVRAEADRLRRVWAGWLVLYEKSPEFSPMRTALKQRLQAADNAAQVTQEEALALEAGGDNAYWLVILRQIVVPEAEPNEDGL